MSYIWNPSLSHALLLQADQGTAQLWKKMVNGEQLTDCWHVDDLKSSHINPKVNDEFLQWIKDTFGQLGEVKTT